MISSFFILNSSGSMIYSYQKKPTFNTNSLLVLCSSLYSIRYMIKTNKSLIRFHFKSQIISMYSTLTGTIFVFVGDENTATQFKQIHKDFCDFVMLDPFYNLGMPINCEKFKPDAYLGKDE